jgi:hypothetical protein
VRPEKNSPLAKLQEQFIRLRITNMAEVDIGVFEMDFNTTFGLFILNHRKEVYVRYGARNDAGAETYLSFPSVAIALQRGLNLHKTWKSGDLKAPPAGKSRMSQTFPNVRKTVRENKCVHCHQVAAGQAMEIFALADFNKKTSPWIFPDPAKLGLGLKVDDPTIVESSSGAASKAGIKNREQILKVEDRDVSTFADIQYVLHHLPRERKELKLTTNQGSRKITLPPHWRVTDLNRRSIGHKMDPFPGFWGKPLSSEEKKALRLPPESFATRATKFWVNTPGKKAGMREGDVVTAVDGVTSSPLAVNAQVFIRLNYEAGDEVTVTYRRGRKAGTAKYRLKAKPW